MKKMVHAHVKAEVICEDGTTAIIPASIVVWAEYENGSDILLAAEDGLHGEELESGRVVRVTELRYAYLAG